MPLSIYFLWSVITNWFLLQVWAGFATEWDIGCVLWRLLIPGRWWNYFWCKIRQLFKGLHPLAYYLQGFFNNFSRRRIGFHRQTKHFELGFFFFSCFLQPKSSSQLGNVRAVQPLLKPYLVRKCSDFHVHTTWLSPCMPLIIDIILYTLYTCFSIQGLIYYWELTTWPAPMPVDSIHNKM